MAVEGRRCTKNLMVSGIIIIIVHNNSDLKEGEEQVGRMTTRGIPEHQGIMEATNRNTKGEERRGGAPVEI